MKDPSTPHPFLSDGPSDPLMWRPSADEIERSRLRRFCESTGNDSIEALRVWAADDPGRYWNAVVEDLDLRFEPPYSTPLSLESGPEWAEWFVDGGFNYVVNALDRRVTGPDGDRCAITWEDESGTTRMLTYRDLLAEVNRFANGLIDSGVNPGDRIGIFLPMVPEAVVATLACSRIGAIFIPLFSGYGADAIASRLQDCGATVLITADTALRRGKPVPMKAIADAALAQTPVVSRCIVLQRGGTEVPWTPGRDRWWHDVVSGQADTFSPSPTAANDPYMIIYTSGTTGRPKGTVHVHAGFPIKAAHDLAWCFDLHPGDRLFWLSDLGWMMGPWLIAGGLLLGATLVLYDGTPNDPTPARLWQVVERHRVTHLGIAPTVVRALRGHGDHWLAGPDLGSLRVLGSTGEMWDPDSWRWFFENVGQRRLPIINYSGGTETGGGILGCFTIEPIRACAFSGPIPGMDAFIADEAGQAVQGKVGELVLRQPWVGMTRGFWNAPDRYIETYWSRFPGKWVHGDWSEIDADGYWYIRGRSDDVLKVAGKRVGPAEIESAACGHPAVQEAAAIGVPDDIKGEAIHLFVVLSPSRASDVNVRDDIRLTIRKHLGASLQPAAVHVVPQLPKTRNGKIMRRVIRAAFLGAETGEISALENPTTVDVIATRGAEYRGQESKHLR
jgi:acetyl-CoA synthetase